MRPSHPTRLGGKRRGLASFTLVELLVACVIFTILMLVLFSLVLTSSQVYQQSNGERVNRETARLVLAMIGRDMENAVFPPNSFVASPLQFRFNTSAFTALENPDACFWQTTVAGTGPGATPGIGSTDGDIEDVGYYVQWVQVGSQAHGTLCRFQVPASNANSTFSNYSGGYGDPLSTAIVTSVDPGMTVTNLASANAYKGLVADDVLGLWINLYTGDPTSNPPVTPPFTVSAGSTALPTCADISVVMVDPALAARITSAATITGFYTSPAGNATNAAAFVKSLPAWLQSGTRVFTTRVPMQTGQ